jgi:hypothetical protein
MDTARGRNRKHNPASAGILTESEWGWTVRVTSYCNSPQSKERTHFRRKADGECSQSPTRYSSARPAVIRTDAGRGKFSARRHDDTSIAVFGAFEFQRTGFESALQEHLESIKGRAPRVAEPIGFRTILNALMSQSDQSLAFALFGKHHIHKRWSD